MNDQLKIIVQAAIDIQKSTQKLNEQIKQIKTDAIKLGVQIDDKAAKQAINNTQKFINVIKNKASAAASNFQSYLNNIKPIALKEFSSEIENVVNGFKNVKSQADLTKVNSEVSSLKGKFRELNLESKSFGTIIKDNFVKFTQWFIIAGIVSGVTRSIGDLVTNVKELDKSIMNLQMATGYSYNKTSELLNTYNELAQRLGATTVEVANSADTWLRQGKSIEETNVLIEDSMILSKIAQLDSAQSTEYLTSAMKGYRVAVSDVLGIVDKLSAVDLRSATSAGGLAEAMSRVSNSAQIAGVSMDKLLGYLATVGEVTQKDMSSIGESFKTIFSRLGNVAAGKDIDEEGEAINNVEQVLNSLDIKLRDTQDQFRNFGDVLDEIGSKWIDYSNVEQNQIATAVAGKQAECSNMQKCIVLAA